jgi:hypothetical protein
MSLGRLHLILSALVVYRLHSSPLFVSIAGGMMMGHAIFNAQDSLMKWRDVITKATVKKQEMTHRNKNNTEG